MRGACNEDQAFSALQDKHGVQFVFETGLLMKRDNTYYACSPDGVPLVYFTVMDGIDGWESSRNVVWEDAMLSVVPVKIQS